MVGLLMGIGGGLLLGGMIQRRRMRRHSRGPWSLMRALDLDHEQRDELHDLFHRVRRTARGLRGKQDWLKLVEVLAAPSFDRTKLEQAAAEKSAVFEQLKNELIAGLEHAHAILRPEQRERLADWFGVGGFAPAGGPYR